MKITFSIPRILLITAIAAGLTINTSSCHKDASSTSATVTEADAAQLTTSAVTPSSGGMASQLNSSVSIYNSAKFSCGVEKDSSFSIASVSGASPSYSYLLKWSNTLTCNGLAPGSLTFNFTGAGSYNGPLMSSSDNSKGGFVMTGFGAGSSFIFNTAYNRTGTTTSKVLRQYTFNSVVNITGTNIAVDKTTDIIASGTATVSITCTSSGGKTYTFNGIITFLGNKKANLVLNSGATYIIQWS